MASPPKNDEHNQDKQLYEALSSENGDRVLQLCENIPEGPLHELTIHNDTVLHIATFSKQEELVLKLLEKVPETQNNTLMAKNDMGNTILHDAATSNKLMDSAREMLRREPKLLLEKNKSGESALAFAAWYGKMKMFKFLDGEVKKTLASEVEDEGRIKFYQREDQSTILHLSVLAEHFELALYIAKEHAYIVNEKDGNGMTALQLLACNPSAFENGSKHYLKRLINSCVSTQDATVREEGESCCKVPLWEAIRGKNQRYKSAVDLAKFLIVRDTSWEASKSAQNLSILKPHDYGPTSTSQDQAIGKVQRTSTKPITSNVGEVQRISTDPITSKEKTAETPLFLATKSGILEIVKGILDEYPQAIEHIDDNGRNILHVAIEYRQIHIFDFVEKLGMPMRRLIRKFDNDGNSIVHMVGKYPVDHNVKEMRSPARLLQEDLLLFERVKKLSTIHFAKHFNNDGRTAETLLAENNTKHRVEAKEWLKRTAENCSIVAVLISTVAFAAAYTIPGGPNPHTGYPLLINKSFFVIFTLGDVLSLTFALTSVITFLSILTSSFRLEDFKQSLPQKLLLGFTLLIISVSMMMLAFAATVILLIQNRQQWTRIALYSVAFLPVCIFVLSYLPMYMELMNSFIYSIKKIGVAFPQFDGVFFRSKVAKFKSGSSTRSFTPQTSDDPV